MAEPIYKELGKHLQSRTVSLMEKALRRLANGPFNVMYGSEARKDCESVHFRLSLSIALY